MHLAGAQLSPWVVRSLGCSGVSIEPTQSVRLSRASENGHTCIAPFCCFFVCAARPERVLFLPSPGTGLTWQVVAWLVGWLVGWLAPR